MRFRLTLSMFTSSFAGHFTLSLLVNNFFQIKIYFVTTYCNRENDITYRFLVPGTKIKKG